MELRHLRYFVAVAKAENVSRAAKSLNLSQPPLSRQIRDLEDELGLALFGRSGNTVFLTEAGRVFFLEAEAILRRVENAVSFTRSIDERKRNRIRVGHSAASSLEALPNILRSFYLLQNQTAVELRTLTTSEIICGLHRGELDIGLSVCGDSEDFDGLVVEQVGAYDFLVAAPKHHRFASMSKVSVQSVASEPVITVSKSRYRWYNACVGGFLSLHNDSFKFAEEHDSAHGVIASVEAGRGVALVYDVMATTMLDRVVVRPLTPNPASAPLVVFYREEARSPLIDNFIDAARAAKADAGSAVLENIVNVSGIDPSVAGPTFEADRRYSHQLVSSTQFLCNLDVEPE